MSLDYLVVGAGLFGAVCARELADAGKRVLVVEREPHVGGACRTEVRDGIICQSHGGHIYHTNDRRLWDYVNRFSEFRQYHHQVKANVRGHVYALPISLMTLQAVFGVQTPEEARGRLNAERARVLAGINQADVRGWCLANIGPTLYRMFVEGYTGKQWGRDPGELPASIVRRLPVRLTWEGGYFDDDYQGLPSQGYTPLIERMLEGIRVILNEDYLARRTYWDGQARRVIYTGPVDALLGYQLGRLEYRGLRFEWERVEQSDFQGCPTMNYPDADVPWTRIHEHKHFYGEAQGASLKQTSSARLPHTWITREYPVAAGPDAPPYYPVNDAANQERYEAYARMAAGRLPHVLLGGRLGSFRYLDMHQCIAAALKLVERELE